MKLSFFLETNVQMDSKRRLSSKTFSANKTKFVILAFFLCVSFWFGAAEKQLF